MPVGRLGRLVIALRNAESPQDFDRGLNRPVGGDRLVKGRRESGLGVGREVIGVEQSSCTT